MYKIESDVDILMHIFDVERPWYIHQTYFRKKFDENNNTFHVLHNFSMKITLLFMFYAAPQQLAKLSKENTFAVGQNK